MRIRCYGARGSIPVSGPEYVRFGGDTACLEVLAGGQTLVFDAGSGIRRLGFDLVREGRLDLTLILTHTHWDHIIGFPFFRPLYRPEARIHVYGCRRRQGDLRRLLSRAMAGPFFPVPFERIEPRLVFQELCAEDGPEALPGPAGIRIQSIPLSHPNLGLGFRVWHEGRSFVFLTDNELGFHHRGGRTLAEYAEFCRGAELLIHDAEYNDKEYAETRGYGHSTWADALELAIAAEVGHFALYHHNQDRFDDELEAMVMECRREAKRRGSKVECFAMAQGMILEV